jgi:hypothetical protein
VTGSAAARCAALAFALIACAGEDDDDDAAGSESDAAPVVPDAPPNVDPRPIQLGAIVDGTPANLPFVAASADGGEWQVLTGEAGVYQLTAGRYALFYVCEFTAGETPSSATFFLHATADDFTSITRGCETGAVQPVTQRVFGTVGGLGEGQTADVAMGPGSGRSGVETGYGLRVPIGTWDMVVARDDGVNTDQVIVRRDVAVGEAELRQDFDFAAEGAAIATIPVSAGNRAPGEAAFFSSFLHLGDGAKLFLLADGDEVALVPAELLDGNDIHEIEVVLRFGDLVRSASTFAAAPAEVEFTLLDPIAASVATASEQPLALRATAEPDPSATSYAARYVQRATGRRELELVFTAAAVGSAGLDYTPPMAELAALPGWNPAWELAAGVDTRYTVTIRASNRPPSFDHDLDPATEAGLEGALGRAAALEGTLVP